MRHTWKCGNSGTGNGHSALEAAPEIANVNKKQKQERKLTSQKTKIDRREHT